MARWIPRWLHRAYARFGGFFWKACPRCGRMFGGHEGARFRADWEFIPTDGGPLYLTCPDCQRIGVSAVTMGAMADGEPHVVEFSCRRHGSLYRYPDARQFEIVKASRAVPLSPNIPQPIGGEWVLCPFCGLPLEPRIVS